MPTLEQISASIKRQASGQINSDDNRLEDRFLHKVIADKRKMLLQRDYGRGLGVAMSYYQQIDCLEVKCAAVECLGLPSGVTYHYVDLPAGTSDHLAYLGKADGSLPFDHRPLMSFNSGIQGRFNITAPFFTVLQDRAFIKRIPDGMDLLRLVAILYDPVEMGCRRLLASESYPIPDANVHELEVLVLKQLLSTLPIPADLNNDTAPKSSEVAVNTKNLN